jgi:hypothetical protein
LLRLKICDGITACIHVYLDCKEFMFDFSLG